ncbi:MAG: tetratricopeptide repeat protein [Nitrospirota bacterium]
MRSRNSLASVLLLGIMWNPPLGGPIKQPAPPPHEEDVLGLKGPIQSAEPSARLGLPELPDGGPRFETPVQGPGAGLFEQGVAASRRKDFRSAEQAFRALLQQHPTSPLAVPARAFLADLLVAGRVTNRRRLEAIETYRALIRDVPHSPNAARAYWRMGDLLADLGMRVEAQGTYQLGMDSTSGADADRALLGLAVNFRAWGKLKEAEQAFQRLRQQAGDEEMLRYAVFGLADTLLGLQQLAAAEVEYRTGAQRWPEFLRHRPLALLRFADTEAALGREQEARRLYTEFYNHYPRSLEAPAVLVRIGDGFRRAGMKGQAEQFYADAIVRHPGSTGASTARMRLAELGLELATADKEHALQYQVRGLFRIRPAPSVDSGERRKVFRAVASAYKDLLLGSEALYHLGEDFELLQDWPQAVRVYREVVARDGRFPDDPWPPLAGHRLAVILEPRIVEALNTGDDFTAVVLYHQRGEFESRPFVTPETLLRLAAAHQRLGFSTEAVKLYQTLLVNRAASDLREEVLVGLGRSYVDQEDFTAARQVFTRYRLQYPAGRWQGEVLQSLAQIHRRNGDWEGTVRLCRNWLKRYPSHPDRPTMLLLLAEALTENGEDDEALRAYGEADRAGFLSDPAALIRYADLLAQAKRYDEAVTRYRMALRDRIAPAQAEWVRLQLARVRRAQAYYADARAVLKELGATAGDELVARLSASMRADLSRKGGS